MKKLRVALVSCEIKDRDTFFNLSQMEKYMQAAKEKGADIACFGEAFLQGFNCLCWEFERDKSVAVSLDSDLFSKIKKLTLDIGIDILFGYVEGENDKIYSSCALISNGETVHNYRRISEGWKEYWHTDFHYADGDKTEIFEYRERVCAIALCGDMWDKPESFALSEDILFWPVYTSFAPEAWDKSEKYEYAKQSGFAGENTDVLYINSLCGNDAHGASVHFKRREIVKELEIGAEGILFVDI